MKRFGRRVGCGIVVERHFHDGPVLARSWRRAGRRIDRLVIRRIHLHPKRILIARHFIREDGGLHDVHDCPASCGRGLLAFGVEKHLSCDHHEDRRSVGVHASGIFRSRRTGVVSRVLFRIENDLFLPGVLAGMHLLQVGELPQRSIGRFVDAARSLVHPPRLCGSAAAFPLASLRIGHTAKRRGQAHGRKQGGLHSSSPSFLKVELSHELHNAEPRLGNGGSE